MPPKSINNSVNVHLSALEQMLIRPEMYIRDPAVAEINTVLLTAEKNVTLVQERTKINHGMDHLPLEIISNAIDNIFKNDLLEQQKASIDALARGPKKYNTLEARQSIWQTSAARIILTITSVYMTVRNFGSTFDIDFMPGLKDVFIPEACFMFTNVSSNYKDDEKPNVGIGRNGYGAKTVTAYSKSVTVECVDSIRKRYFKLTALNNGREKSIEVWPAPVNGVMIDGTKMSSIPANYAKLFAEESYTDVRWIPDYEETVEDSKFKEFLAASTVGDDIVVRQSSRTGESSESRCKVGPNGTIANTRGDTFEIESLPAIRQIRNVTSKKSLPSAAMVFRGSVGISDADINFVARYAADFSVCGIPFCLRRRWNDGKGLEQWIYPRTIEEYGLSLMPDGCLRECFDVQNKEGSITASVAVFDTPGKGRAIGFVNGLWTEKGVHINETYSAIQTELMTQKAYTKYCSKCDIGDLKKHISIAVAFYGTNPKHSGQTKTDLSALSGRKGFTLHGVPHGSFADWTAITALSEKGKDEDLEKKKAKFRGKRPECYVSANRLGPDSTLLLIEGDSCLGYAEIMRNLQSGNNGDKLGIFAMRGVPPNLYGSGEEAAYANKVFAMIMKITGLTPGVNYVDDKEEFSKLDYGRIVFIGDPDLDGFHIVALMLANILNYWPSMFELKRIGALRTPVVRIWKGDKILARYYSDIEFKIACENGTVPKGEAKRIKGLGSVDAGALDLPKPEIIDDALHAWTMWFDMTATGKEALSAFFDDAPGMSDERKRHVARLAEQCHDMRNICTPDTNCGLVALGEGGLVRRDVVSFVKKELMQYSLGSIVRQIPDVRDGLKDVHRKAIAFWLEHTNFGARKGARKVEHLAGQIAEKNDYHHGGKSLGDSIKRMSISGFVGANNVPFFEAKSGNGSKMNWPADAAADRYAIVDGSNWIKYAFHRDIYDCVPRQLSADVDSATGKFGEIEPTWIPCDIPLAVMNGVFGISTGYGTFMPPCHPYTIVDWLISRAKGDGALPEIIFWYGGFKGIISRAITESHVVDENGEESTTTTMSSSIVAAGIWKLVELGPEERGKSKKPVAVLEITEIPPEMRIIQLEKTVRTLMEKGLVVTKWNSTKNGIKYRLGLSTEGLSAYGRGSSEAPLIRALKLVSRHSLAKFVFTNETGSPQLYKTIDDYMQEFYRYAIAAYELGKRRSISDLYEKIAMLRMRKQYIQACLSKRIIIGEMNRATIYLVMDELKIDREMTKTDCALITAEGIVEIDEKISAMEQKIAEAEAKRVEDSYIENLIELRKHLPKHPLPTRHGDLYYV